ncbi:MAG: Rdx family protein [Chloroflexi bacterium]|nr:Rdx family protein [Chloroflexota bacterium]MCH8349858.1 Rdx family protein [Chloroflexota bacterium]MCI0781638.1 Rdx family protein [Chloroflexota bacterium]MCI0786316.1 Rdx family protein [Chloroflexota bacterium]MCI0793634.1 Rdx family protein [Chloroflexota bacterium]
MANEFFRHFGPDVSLTISPRGQGIMEVFVDGERIYDKKGEGDVFPDLKRVREMRTVIAEKIAGAVAVPADN